MTALPDWPAGTAAVLAVAGPHAIPISTALRAGDRRIVFALGRRRETLARLRNDPAVALTVLAAGLAFTAHGRASVVAEQLPDAPPVVAVELQVERVQDHLADGRTEMLDAPRWRWREQRADEADARVRAALTAFIAGRPRAD